MDCYVLYVIEIDSLQNVSILRMKCITFTVRLQGQIKKKLWRYNQYIGRRNVGGAF